MLRLILQSGMSKKLMFCEFRALSCALRVLGKVDACASTPTLSSAGSTGTSKSNKLEDKPRRSRTSCGFSNSCNCDLLISKVGQN